MGWVLVCVFVSTCVIEIADFKTFWDGAINIRVASTHLVSFDSQLSPKQGQGPAYNSTGNFDYNGIPNNLKRKVGIINL